MDEKPKKTATSPTGKFGIYDTTDKCWMGGDKGPVRYDDWDLARLAAAVANQQLGWRPGRIRATGFVDDVMILRDVVSTQMTPLEAIQKLEAQ